MLLKRMRNHGRNFSRVIIVGTNVTALRLYEAMLSDAGYGFRVLGFFDQQPQPGFNGRYIGGIDRISAFVRDEAVDEIFYTISGENEDVLRDVVKIADDNVVQFHYVPQISRYIGRRFQLSGIGEIPTLSSLVNPMNRMVNRTAKRAFDIAFSSVVLLFSPLVLIPVAIAIKASSPGRSSSGSSAQATAAGRHILEIPHHARQRRQRPAAGHQKRPAQDTRG